MGQVHARAKAYTKRTSEALTDMATQTTIVSPDVIEGKQAVTMAPIAHQNQGVQDVKLVAVPEWKQAAQRGIRSFLQAITFFLGGGALVSNLQRNGIAPELIGGLPTFNNPLIEALVYSLAFGLGVFVWNWIEFTFDIDIKFPGWRV